MVYDGSMKNNATNDYTEQVGVTRCTRAERDNAFNLSAFLYDGWREKQKNEIIELDKTNHDNNEHTNIN